MRRLHIKLILTLTFICVMMFGLGVQASEVSTRTTVGSYESELALFPADYQEKLQILHQNHPNWLFVAVDTGLDWSEVVREESINEKSLLEKTGNYSELLFSKESGNYNSSTGAYIIKDGNTWVSANKPAVAYYVDPRNFLNEKYIFLFEALDFNKDYHTLEGVESILKGTDLSYKLISYIDTNGKTVQLDKTYGQVIYAAGEKYGVSPLFLASKIKQETSGKLTNGSISGQFSYNGVSYMGYYNFYNIGATATATGSAVANGLTYAKASGSYGRPWTSPVRAIEGGAQYISGSYISNGQNTSYFQKINTIVKPYYSHQYMQALTAAASEGYSNRNSYNSLGLLDNEYVFYIPVYNNMPSQTTKVSIEKTVYTGKTTSSVNMRPTPTTNLSALTTIPGQAEIAIDGGVYIDETMAIYNQLTNPYWFKVTYKNYSGYVSAEYVEMNTDFIIAIGATKQLVVQNVPSGETVYYESGNPTVASVDSNGIVKGLKEGTSTIYAISDSGKAIDAVGVEIRKTAPAEKTLSSIYISKAPTKISYVAGEKFDKTGMIVKAKWSDGTETDITSSVQISVAELTEEITSVQISYTYGGVTKTVDQAITVGTNVSLPVGYTQYKVTGNNVNYRTGPGTSYAIVGKLQKGDVILVENWYSANANGNTWYRFVLNGKTYYVSASYLEKVESTPAGMNFTDVTVNDWFYEDVKYVFENKIVEGTSKTTFSPVLQLTRAQFATILYRMEGNPNVSGASNFTDVEKDTWYTNAISWAAEAGIVKGYSKEIFGTNEPLQREQMVTMMCRYAAYKGNTISGTDTLKQYRDAATVSEYAVDSMKWAVKEGLIKGKDDGSYLDPKGSMTRAECAAVIARYMKK